MDNSKRGNERGNNLNAKSHLKIEVANLLKLCVFFGCGGRI